MANSGDSNPWQDQTSTNEHGSQQHTGHLLDQHTQNSQNPWQLGGSQMPDQSHPSFQARPDPWANQQHGGYAAPPGPPPTQARSQAPTLPDETARFVPEAERGEQREALEHFEMSHHGQQSQDDRNIEALTKQFPKIDGALVAAIYNDSRDMGASREMLGELSDTT